MKVQTERIMKTIRSKRLQKKKQKAKKRRAKAVVDETKSAVNETGCQDMTASLQVKEHLVKEKEEIIFAKDEEMKALLKDRRALHGYDRNGDGKEATACGIKAAALADCQEQLFWFKEFISYTCESKLYNPVSGHLDLRFLPPFIWNEVMKHRAYMNAQFCT